MYRKRLEKLRRKLPEEQIDALLVTDPVDRTYLSGFTGTSGLLLITEREAFLLTDFRYLEQSEQQASEFKTVERDKKFPKTVGDISHEYGIKSMGFEADSITYRQYLDLKDCIDNTELIPVNGLLKSLRSIKDEQETDIIKTAVRIADDAFSHILNFIKPGIRERDVAAELEYFMRLQGADKSSFDIIVASGYRGALPHGVASDKTLQQGEMIVMDYGALYGGYCSDFTRTVVLGKADEEQRNIYNIVLKAQMEALKFIGPGKAGRDVDGRARDIITGHGYGDNFGHSLGHGVGLEIHEQPFLNKHVKDILAPGMIVTVEPGIYVKGFCGVRIEDMVKITPGGREILTKSTKKLVEI